MTRVGNDPLGVFAGRRPRAPVGAGMVLESARVEEAVPCMQKKLVACLVLITGFLITGLGAGLWAADAVEPADVTRPTAALSPPTAPAAREAATLSGAEPPSPFIRPKAAPTTRPVGQIRRVLVVSIDGLRPDLMLLGDTPNLHELMKRGCYTMWARTTPNSVTLPSHVSMMTGVSPRRHEVEWNREFKTVDPLYPRVPTLFEAAKCRGYTTAVAAGKSKFDMFDRPGVLDWKWIPTKTVVETADVIGPAVRILQRTRRT